MNGRTDARFFGFCLFVSSLMFYFPRVQLRSLVFGPCPRFGLPWVGSRDCGRIENWPAPVFSFLLTSRARSNVLVVVLVWNAGSASYLPREIVLFVGVRSALCAHTQRACAKIDLSQSALPSQLSPGCVVTWCVNTRGIIATPQRQHPLCHVRFTSTCLWFRALIVEGVPFIGAQILQL